MSTLNTLKHWVRDLVRYPVFRPADSSYNAYWSERDIGASLNSFQRARIHLLLTKIQDGDSVLDVGCGDGRVLQELVRQRPRLDVLGIDSAQSALEQARRRGVPTHEGDIRKLESISLVPRDWVLLLEVIEHVTDSEDLLTWARTHGEKGVVFSVPNTGFFTHRLRLLLGRFPLQWRAHPAEHVRFWTLSDMKYWLNALGYRYEIHPYEGVPFLSRVWPSLFAAGLFVVLPRT